ncbi:MAG: tetratricopeptide repeat protein, partial [Kofleriaceae bacterium]|nr:tetratricopeptide repeat protein [Kofleriaceae bacterium]
LVSENADLDFAQAFVEELAGDPTKAREMLSSILKAHPSLTRARYALAEFEKRQGNLDAAISVIQPLIEENPLNFDALNYIGYALIEIPGRRKQARLLLQRAIELAPDNAFILDSFGWLLYHEGKLQQAERFLERAARLSPAQPEAIAHLAELRWRQGDTVQANRLFTRATGLAQSPTMRTKIQSRQHLLNTKP